MENNEIDLWQLALDGLKFFRKKKAIILFFFFLGVVFSISNFFTHPLQYKSFYKKDFIAESSVASNEILYDIINGIPPKFANTPTFRSLKGTLAVNRLKVTIEVFDKKDVGLLLNSITSYVDSIKSLRERFELTKKQDIYLLSLLKEKIARSDSAKNNSEYENQIELVEKKQGVEKKLALNKIITFIELNPDYIFINNRREGILNVLGYSFLGIVAGFIAAIFTPDLINSKK